ncbi:J domain-containing protein [Pseudomonas fluorescens]|uniref:J domain-containing protein n=1 Tax=Pseudomonas fluorescens TaxID=294 RepID=UPI0030DB05CD
MSCWIRLGIEPTTDETLIRNAYRTRLPEHHPETDPEGFQALRMAYEKALRLAREGDEEEPEEFEEYEEPEQTIIEVPQAFVDFCELLDDPLRRFDFAAWQSFIRGLDQLPLESLDDLSWGLYHRLADAGPLSYRCANLLAERMAWDQQLLELSFDDAERVEAFLQRIKAGDPFDTDLMSAWSEAAQTESLWYARSLDFIFAQRPLHEFADFASRHTCLPLPNDEMYIKRLVTQFTQAGMGGAGWLQCCEEQQGKNPEDVDWLYLLACQSTLLGLDDQAWPCWIRLWQEYRHPTAESHLMAMCAERQPDFLPLLIQAFDRAQVFSEWSRELDHVSQQYGSPSQRPETLARWVGIGSLELQGLAKAFVDWRMSDDELPLLALLLGNHDDPRLQRLYRHAWALHRGDVPLLQQMLDEPLSMDALEALVLSGFKQQAEQHVRWLTQAPIPLAMSAYTDANADSPQLPEALKEGFAHSLCRLWLRRLRPYSRTELERIAEDFKLNDAHATLDLSELALLLQLSLGDVQLPPPGAAEALWQWHAQTLFLLALLGQTERWLPLIDARWLEQLPYNPAHPLSRLQPLLQRLLREQGNCEGLLGLLQTADPVHALLARQMCGVQEALASLRLLSNDRLFECMRSELSAFDDDLLGRMLLTAVLYHCGLFDAKQRRFLLDRITEIVNPQDWFDGFRHSLIKGEPARPPREALENEGVNDIDAFYLALDVLKDLVLYGNAGVPRQKTLMRLQRAKDDTQNGLGLRFAFSALLSWSERLLLAKADTRPVAATAFWRLGTRLGREAFVGQVIGIVLLTPLLALFSGSMTSAFVVLAVALLLLLSAMLRRLHDMGRGVATFLVLAGLTPVLPFLPLVLFGFPGEKLPNRYGVPPESFREDPLSGGLQAALRRLIG